MKKAVVGISEIKGKVRQLQGKDVRVRYNKGRNRIVYYDGRIEEIYPAVFVIRIFNELFDKITCSYQDVLCGDVKFKVRN